MSSLPDLPEYEIGGKIAVGGMAEIYRARARSGPLAGREVVLKRLLPLFRSERAYVEMFLGEARMGVLLVHPNIVRTHDLFRAGLDYFIVQDLAPGLTLGKLRARAAGQGRTLSLAAGLVAVSDLLEALEYLHAGAGFKPAVPIIHRDVNPENLVAGPDGVARLIDFGIAERLGESSSVRAGALRGTPAYMSPEQVKSRPLDPRADLFAAGIVLWEVLAGRTLFARENEFETLRHVAEVGAPPLRLVAPSTHPAFERLCVRALAPQRDRRFDSAAEMRRELAEAAARAGIPLDRSALARAASEGAE